MLFVIDLSYINKKNYSVWLPVFVDPNLSGVFTVVNRKTVWIPSRSEVMIETTVARK